MSHVVDNKLPCFNSLDSLLWYSEHHLCMA